MPESILAAALEAELIEELRHGVVIWLDRENTYGAFVDALVQRSATGAFRWPVVALRGSFVELLLAIGDHGSGPEPTPLLVHLPGLTEDEVKDTPLLELYELGRRYRRALETLVREAARGRVLPDAVEEFLRRPPGSFELAARWLDDAAAGEGGSVERALEALEPHLVAAELARLALGDASGPLSRLLHGAGDVRALQDWLARHTGIDHSWVRFAAGEVPGGDKLAFAFIAWILAVEYVHDLARQPVHSELIRLRALSKPLVSACTSIARQLRSSVAEQYAVLADDVEQLLAADLDSVRPEDLGEVDTFRAEERTLLSAAVEALCRGDWDLSLRWAGSRAAQASVWIEADPARRRAWQLAREIASLGRLIARAPAHGFERGGLAEATAWYEAHGASVDRAHRSLEQEQARLLDPSLPDFTRFKEALRAVRGAWARWATDLARAWSRVSQSGGFLPDTTLQQRMFFEQVVTPLLATGERTAVVLLDAFRFEMAAEVAEALRSPGALVEVKPRLAELPTVTSVGMNVLAPAARGDGRLDVAGIFQGFRTGEFVVSTPDQRARAMTARAGGRTLLLSLSDAAVAEPGSLARRLRDVRLVVVHGTELDDAGEANVGLLTFPQTLRTVLAACAQLRNAGVQQIVVTSDHGFLLLDDAVEPVRFGSAREARRRWVIDAEPRAGEGLTSVPLSKLGYDGIDGHLVLREDLAPFATAVTGAFVHGGNSPQERVIPVIIVSRARAAGATQAAYAIEAETLEPVAGLHRIRVRVRHAERTTSMLPFVGARSVTVAVRALDESGVVAVLKQAGPPAELDGPVLRIPVEAREGAELLFTLEGTSSARARIELHHPDAAEQVASWKSGEWFEVSYRGAVRAVAPAPPANTGWADAIGDEGARMVFEHLSTHGSIEEVEVTRMLGSPRAFRKFSLAFDQLARMLPFRVRIEAAAGGKRYVKEGDR